MAFLVPGRQLALQTDTGTYREYNRTSSSIMSAIHILSINITKL